MVNMKSFRKNLEDPFYVYNTRDQDPLVYKKYISRVFDYNKLTPVPEQSGKFKNIFTRTSLIYISNEISSNYQYFIKVFESISMVKDDLA